MYFKKQMTFICSFNEKRKNNTLATIYFEVNLKNNIYSIIVSLRFLIHVTFEQLI